MLISRWRYSLNANGHLYNYNDGALRELLQPTILYIVYAGKLRRISMLHWTRTYINLVSRKFQNYRCPRTITLYVLIQNANSPKTTTPVVPLAFMCTFMRKLIPAKVSQCLHSKMNYRFPRKATYSLKIISQLTREWLIKILILDDKRIN